MKRLQLLFYHKSFAVTSYYKRWYTVNDKVSSYVELMGYLPVDEDQRLALDKIINGWVSWVKKLITEENINVDIIIRVLGHDELEINANKPMYILADRLAQEINATFKPRLIKKIRVTRPQKDESSAWKRRYNIKGSFKASEEYEDLANKNILVLDNIVSSGFTAIEISKTLMVTEKNKLYFLALGENNLSPNTDTELLNWLDQARHM